MDSEQDARTPCSERDITTVSRDSELGVVSGWHRASVGPGRAAAIAHSGPRPESCRIGPYVARDPRQLGSHGRQPADSERQAWRLRLGIQADSDSDFVDLSI